MKLHLITKCAVSIPQQDRDSIASHVCGDKIGDAVLIEIKWIDRCRIFPNFVTSEIVKQIWRSIRVLLRTSSRIKVGENRDRYQHGGNSTIAALHSRRHTQLLVQKLGSLRVLAYEFSIPFWSPSGKSGQYTDPLLALAINWPPNPIFEQPLWGFWPPPEALIIVDGLG
jgi:hypothetical protein